MLPSATNYLTKGIRLTHKASRTRRN